MKLLYAVKKAANLRRRIYIIGNGGSYANSVHLANDLLSCGIRAFAMDAATLSAFANDFGYETVFSRWIRIVGEVGDLLIALSGSGNSPNIIRALVEARLIGMATFSITGSFANPEAIGYSDNSIVEGHDMQAAENYQLIIGHEVMLQLKKERQCASR